MNQTVLLPTRWTLYRIDDNNNQFDMMTFENKKQAELTKDHYEAKKHKQAYFLREELTP